MSDTSYLYEFKMDLFDNGKLEELLLFVKSFNMTLTVSRTLVMGATIQYIRSLVSREVLR